MPFVSTRAPSGRRYRLAEALRLGLSPADGGLFLPTHIEPLGETFWRDLGSRSLPEIGAEVLLALLGGESRAELPRAVIEPLAAEALDFDIPLREVMPGRFVLELFHGPTLAFKDVGARFLARLLRATASEVAVGEDGLGDATVLVATSGDTGGAVAHAFHGVAGTRVVILYPRGKVSPLQERQLTTLGGNVRAYAVDGVFDDCQRMVKAAFADRDLAIRHRLTSANSINVGRLLPQAIYYVHAAAQLAQMGGVATDRAAGSPPVFVVPSGNFGNLTAGVLARRLGLDARFVAATNANDVVPEYLRTGIYAPRPSQPTVSNAMDVGDPSNLERLRHLYGDDLAALRRDVEGIAFDDAATRRAIASVDRESGVVLDPHTAVGWLALEALPVDGPGIVLGTAHPAKFLETVEPAIGRPVPLPPALAALVDRPLGRQELEPEPEALVRALDASV